jgi:hypothetical protein
MFAQLNPSRATRGREDAPESGYRENQYIANNLVLASVFEPRERIPSQPVMLF